MSCRARVWAAFTSQGIGSVAITTNERQHTLLARFVLITPDDPIPDMETETILADVNAILPGAVELLAESPTGA
jgi:hypothetical protein